MSDPTREVLDGDNASGSGRGWVVGVVVTRLARISGRRSARSRSSGYITDVPRILLPSAGHGIDCR
jgi:hypothetical protein